MHKKIADIHQNFKELTGQLSQIHPQIRKEIGMLIDYTCSH